MSNLVPMPSQPPQVSGALEIKTMDDISRLSKMMASSGFFSDCKEAAQAGVKIMAGLELGFPAFSSMTGIHIISGKPALGSNLMAAAVKRSGRYNYRVLEHSDEICKIAFFEQGEQIGVSEFSAADAKRMGTQHMGKFPRNMLFARAMSNGVKWFCPDLFLGPVYTPDELGATVDDNGDFVDVPVAVVPAAVAVEPTDPASAVITAAQAKRFHAIKSEQGWTDDQAKALLEYFGYQSSKDIVAAEYGEIISHLQNPEVRDAYAQEVPA